MLLTVVLQYAQNATDLYDNEEVLAGLSLLHNLLSVVKLARLQRVRHRQTLPLVQVLYKQIHKYSFRVMLFNSQFFISSNFSTYSYFFTEVKKIKIILNSNSQKIINRSICISISLFFYFTFFFIWYLPTSPVFVTWRHGKRDYLITLSL